VAEPHHQTNIADSLDVVVHVERRPAGVFIPGGPGDRPLRSPDADLFDYRVIYAKAEGMKSESNFLHRRTLWALHESRRYLARSTAHIERAARCCQSITSAETVASPDLTLAQRADRAGSDVFIGMKPLRLGVSRARRTRGSQLVDGSLIRGCCDANRISCIA